MPSNMIKHLGSRQIFQAIVDISDLTEASKNHLASCDKCRARKEQLDRMLIRMDYMARESAPQVTGRLSMPRINPGTLQHFLWSLQPYLRKAVPLLAALAVVITAVVFKAQYDRHMAAAEKQVLLEAEQLMSDIQMLIENPLSPELQRLIFVGPDQDEEYKQHIVPSIENPQSKLFWEKGASIC